MKFSRTILHSRRRILRFAWCSQVDAINSFEADPFTAPIAMLLSVGQDAPVMYYMTQCKAAHNRGGEGLEYKKGWDAC